MNNLARRPYSRLETDTEYREADYDERRDLRWSSTSTHQIDRIGEKYRLQRRIIWIGIDGKAV